MSCHIQKQEISSVKGQLFQIKFNNYCESMSEKYNLNESSLISIFWQISCETVRKNLWQTDKHAGKQTDRHSR